jgi:hypothetical protein
MLCNPNISVVVEDNCVSLVRELGNNRSVSVVFVLLVVVVVVDVEVDEVVGDVAGDVVFGCALTDFRCDNYYFDIT